MLDLQSVPDACNTPWTCTNRRESFSVTANKKPFLRYKNTKNIPRILCTQSACPKSFAIPMTYHSVIRYSRRSRHAQHVQCRCDNVTDRPEWHGRIAEHCCILWTATDADQEHSLSIQGSTGQCKPTQVPVSFTMMAIQIMCICNSTTGCQDHALLQAFAFPGPLKLLKQGASSQRQPDRFHGSQL